MSIFRFAFVFRMFIASMGAGLLQAESKRER